MNVFISIIEEAYVSSKTKDRSHWIYSYLKVDPQYIEIKQDGKRPDDIKKAEIKIEDEGTALLHKDQDKIEQKVQTENTIREILNTKQEEVFEEKKEEREMLNMNMNLNKRESENEVLNILTKSFKSCEDLLDDIEKLIPEVKGVSKESSLEEINRILQENVIMINEKIDYIQNHWQDK